MVRTYGLTHIALGVRDVERSALFYKKVFGSVEVYRQEGFVQLQTPGTRDVLVLEEDTKRAGRGGGIAHFGFRLIDPSRHRPRPQGRRGRGRDDSRARRVRPG